MATTLMIHCQRVELRVKHLGKGNSLGLAVMSDDGAEMLMDITFFCKDRANAEALIASLPRAPNFSDYDEPATVAA